MPEKVELTPRGRAFRDNGNWWTKDPTTKASQSEEHARTTRENVAKLYKELEGLWTDAKANEEETGESYEYVMIFRDDSNWLLDFDLDRLLRTGGQVVLDGSAGRALGQKCGPQGLPRLCDYVVVAERAVADSDSEKAAERAAEGQGAGGTFMEDFQVGDGELVWAAGVEEEDVAVAFEEASF